MREPVSRRTLYTTPPARASEESDKPVIDSEAVAAFKRTATFQKMSRSPEALEAVRKFAEMMQKQGIDFSSGKPLSMIQMSKLLMNSEFRTGAKELVEAMQKAGIDLTTKVCVASVVK
ncbi:hypothetical protein B0H34DRAFT_648702 [Crassisporium funariophilum]|nr:hypothetical protein B0H34DRAFT_648702 [Crassisporium funariophilum]